MKEILKDLIRELEAGRSVALVTLVKRTGSTPRGPGARMLVRSDSSIAGTVGGGALEAFIQRSALQALTNHASVLVPFNLNPEDTNALGMICGGDGQVLVEYIDPDDQRWLESYKSVEEKVRHGGTASMISMLPQLPMVEFAAGHCVISGDGEILARAGSDLRGVDEIAKAALASRTLKVMDELGVIIDHVGHSGTALIFGAGHVARSLVPVLASVGFTTIVLDDRSEFVTPDRFELADERVVLESFANSFAGLSVDQSSYVIIVTRSHVLDKSVLKQALDLPARYVGIIGSRRKLRLTFDALRDEGISDEELQKVHAPIGVDIGAESPAEIAISVAAELIRVRAEKYSA